MTININCDMGESFGLYVMGDDEGVMPYITEANVACGVHGSDPNHMRKTVELAKQHNVKVGAHFSLPDLPGFGRREMKIERDELANIVIYQIGALKGFLDVAGVSLSHMKPHGALYGMSARDGLSGTLHEEIYTARGLEFVSEFFADLDYDETGKLLITREHPALDPQAVGQKALRAVRDGIVVTTAGTEVAVKANTICIHSDTPNVIAIAQTVRASLDAYMKAA